MEEHHPDALASYLRETISALDAFASAQALVEPSARAATSSTRFIAAEVLRRQGDFEEAKRRLTSLRTAELKPDAPLVDAIDEELRLVEAEDSAPHAAPWSTDRERCERAMRRDRR